MILSALPAPLPASAPSPAARAALATPPAQRIQAAIEANPKIRDVALGLVRALGLADAAPEVEFLAGMCR